MDLDAWASLAEIVGALGVVASLIYLGIQIRESKTNAEREGALEMLRSYQTPEFNSMLLASFDVPKGLSKRELEDYFGEKMTDLFAYMAIWESLGIMVYRGQVSLDLVCDFFSHPILSAWAMTEQYTYELRAEAGRETPWEWFHWLTEQVRAAEAKLAPVPAHIEFRDWRP